MASDEELDPTQSQTHGTETNVWLNVDEDPDIWGRLLANNIEMKNYDLTKETFKAGREKGNDCMFDNVNLKIASLISKKHFIITKDLSNMNNPAYIEDLSRNGTYINKEPVLRRCKRILAHNDVISVGHPSHKAFVYKEQRRTTHDIPPIVTEKYYVGQKLGSGACGVVYLVYNYRTCKPFAMKHIRQNQLIDYTNDKSLNEVKIMQNIRHSCVVQMHDFILESDSVYLALEYMRGGDLLSRITNKGFLPEQNAKLFFFQMCHAIKYLHSQKITHRDLKPDNILLDSNDDDTLVKISDFGLSKLIQNNSVLRTLCGTPLYVAPEVLLTNGRGVYTEKVDIWSLGVVLFTELSGTLPFADAYGSPATEQIKRGAFQFRSPNWRSVSSEARKFIRNTLNKNVNLRPSIDELLKHSWLRDFDVISTAHKLMKLPPPNIDDFIQNRMDTCSLDAENLPPPKRRRLR